jgi:ATP-dependent metalloprotease FtsH
MVIHFDLNRKPSIVAVRVAMKSGGRLFAVTQRIMTEETPGLDGLYEIGTVIQVRQITKLPNNTIRVLAEGVGRAKLNDMTTAKAQGVYALGDIDLIEEDDGHISDDRNYEEAAFRTMVEMLSGYLEYHPKISQTLNSQIDSSMSLGEIVNRIAMNIPIAYDKKQQLLEAISTADRYEMLSTILCQETDIAKIHYKLNQDIQSRVNQNQREYIMREQMAILRKELSKGEEYTDSELFNKKVDELEASDEIKERIRKEIRRFDNISESSQEGYVLRSYIETLLELPWDHTAADNTDIEHASEILEEDHYGLDKVKERVLEFLAVRAQTSKGRSPIMCLVGPPGTGKTLLAKAIAGEAEVPFFSISGSDFVEMFVGVGASRVRDLLEEAKKNAPCIVFIDEIDAVARRRGTGMGGGHDEREQTLNQLLVEMDGFGVNEGIIVLAATNRVDILDPAIMRPGRFDRKLAVGTPDIKGRREILGVHSKNKPLAEDVDLDEISKSTSGFTGADLENLMNEAAIKAAKTGRKFIKMSDIRESFLKVGVGAEKKSKVVSDKEKRITAFHESGHAILHYILPDIDPVNTVSIIPTGLGAGGYTMSMPEEDVMFETKGRMLNQIVAILGGRAAESIVLDDITTGASSDIKTATHIAKNMVTRYGMSDNIGAICYNDEGDEVFIGRDLAHARGYSESMASKIDDEVKHIIDTCYEKAVKIINENRDKLDACAELLLEKEKINRAEFEALFGQPDPDSEVSEGVDIAD